MSGKGDGENEKGTRCKNPSSIEELSKPVENATEDKATDFSVSNQS
jgi:hypothetical protein